MYDDTRDTRTYRRNNHTHALQLDSRLLRALEIEFDMLEPRRHQEQASLNSPNGNIMECTKDTGGQGPNTHEKQNKK